MLSSASGRVSCMGTMPSRRCLSAFLLAATIAGNVQGFKSKGEIGSSILVMGPSDYLDFGGGSRCHKMVERAAQLKQSRINFTPSLYWVDEEGEKRKSVNAAGQVTHWCYTRSFPTEKASCPPPTEAERDAFRSSMASCFQKAINSGLSLAVTPHVDDGLGLGGWRNGLVFDPLKKYGNYSYADFMLIPLADAINSVITDKVTVTFALQGEMSATVFYYPKSYEKLLPKIKARILAGKPSSWQDNVETGLSTNFDKLCGCVLQDMIDPSEYLKEFPTAFESQKKNFDTKAIAKAYNTADFIGISNYASMRADFDIKELESATFQFAREASYFGVDVKDLIFNKGKKLYWMEYGVGGGRSQMGNVKATTASEAAATPFFGVFGEYKAATDPWKVPAIRDYLHYFYAQTINYLRSEGTCDGCQYRVDQIYLWNDGSWDIQTIYPESQTSEGSYRDDFAVALIGSHNGQAMTAACACSDTPSEAKMSCVDEVAINRCTEPWYIIGDFCQTSCNRCYCNGVCSDSPPDNRYSCAQQAAWGQCSEAFMSGYCRKSCNACTPSAAEVAVDSHVTAARKHAALLARAGNATEGTIPEDSSAAPSAVHLAEAFAMEPGSAPILPTSAPSSLQEEVFAYAPTPIIATDLSITMPTGPSASEKPASEAPVQAPASGSAAESALPAPLPAPMPAQPTLGLAPAPVTENATFAPFSTPAEAPAQQGPTVAPGLVEDVTGIISLGPSHPYLVLPSDAAVQVTAPSRKERAGCEYAASSSAPAPIVNAGTDNRHSSDMLTYPSDEEIANSVSGKTVVSSWAVVRGMDSLGPGPAPVSASWQEMARSGDFHEAAKAAIEEWRLEADASRRAAAKLAEAPAPASTLTAEEVHDLAEANTVIYKPETANGLMKGTDSPQHKEWDLESRDPQNRRLLLSATRDLRMLAEAAAPAPIPRLSRTAGTRSWLDLARNGDLAGAAGVAAAEYNQMTATVADVTAKTRSGAAGTQDHDTTRARGDHYTTLAKVTQANRLAATTVMALQAWQAAEAAAAPMRAAASPAAAQSHSRINKQAQTYDAALPAFAFTRTNSLAKPTVDPKVIVWTQNAVLTDAALKELLAEHEPPAAPTPAPFGLPFAYVKKAAAALISDHEPAEAPASAVPGAPAP